MKLISDDRLARYYIPGTIKSLRKAGNIIIIWHHPQQARPHMALNRRALQINVAASQRYIEDSRAAPGAAGGISDDLFTRLQHSH